MPDALVTGIVSNALKYFSQYDAAQGKIFTIEDKPLQCRDMWQVTTREEVNPDTGINENQLLTGKLTTPGAHLCKITLPGNLALERQKFLLLLVAQKFSQGKINQFAAGLNPCNPETGLDQFAI